MYSGVYVNKPKEENTEFIDNIVCTINSLIEIKDYENAKKELLKLKNISYRYPKYEITINNLKLKLKKETYIYSK